MVDVDDQAQDEVIELADGASGGSRKKPLVLGLLAAVLLTTGAGGALYFGGILSPAQDAEASVEASESEEIDKGEAIYVGLDPAFTVNFLDKGKGGARFLQIAVQVMTREEEAEAALQKHMPAIRNNLVMLFSSQESVALRAREGKEKLRADTLAAIQNVLDEEQGDASVEGVYFTSFVMQ